MLWRDAFCSVFIPVRISRQFQAYESNANIQGGTLRNDNKVRSEDLKISNAEASLLIGLRIELLLSVELPSTLLWDMNHYTLYQRNSFNSFGVKMQD